MRNDLVLQRRQRTRPWGCLERLILIAFGFCLLVGLGALYLLWSINRQPPSSLADAPEQTLLVDKIVPPLAIRHLAGDSLDGLAQQAIQAGELPTAQSLLLFSDTSQPIVSAARWLELAQKELEQNSPLRAAQATQMAQRIALLDPRLQALEKVQLLTQCAKLYATADSAAGAGSNLGNVANFTIAQITTIVAQTPNLLPAQRSQLFTSLQPIFASLREDEPSRALKLRIDDFARNPFLSPTGSILTPTLFSLVESSSALDVVLPAQLTRQDAAKALVDRYVLTNGVDVEPERLTLQSALLDENKLRLQTMQQALAAASPAQQISLLFEQRTWLTVQLRVALRGYGLPLVPAWEADITGIKRELSENTSAIKNVMEQLASSQPTPEQQSRVRLEAMLWVVEQFELALFPNSSGEELSAQLQFAQTEVERLNGPLALPIVYVASEDHLAFDVQQR